jgi:DNA-binding response OmpR family regulator
MVDAPAPRKVLVVEDDPLSRESLRLHLSVAGFEVTESDDGIHALELTRSTIFDLILLDRMLPGLDGISLCRAVRDERLNCETPILMVTDRDSESDKVIGLDSGADDYLTKPLAVRELLARVRAVLRRSAAAEEQTDPSKPRLIRSHDVILDRERRQTTVRGETVHLTKQEFDLLAALITRPGIVFSRAALLATVWHADTCVTGRTVDTIISRLRRKIECDPRSPELIMTVWGVGYKFVDID